MQHPNENVTSTFDTSPGTDRLSFIWHRARKLVPMLGPWLMFVAGVIYGPLNTVGNVLFALGLLALLTFWYRVRYTMFTDIPHLKIPLTSFTPKQFRHWGRVSTSARSSSLLKHFTCPTASLQWSASLRSASSSSTCRSFTCPIISGYREASTSYWVRCTFWSISQPASLRGIRGDKDILSQQSYKSFSSPLHCKRSIWECSGWKSESGVVLRVSYGLSTTQEGMSWMPCRKLCSERRQDLAINLNE